MSDHGHGGGHAPKASSNHGDGGGMKLGAGPGILGLLCVVAASVIAIVGG